MRQKFRSLFFVCFFVVAMLSTALHELVPSHEADTCPICVVDEHTLSADVISRIVEDLYTPFYTLFIFDESCQNTRFDKALNARAPPKLFS
ncbi:hypothetical protein [Sulfurimonas sp. HSL3-7]|uniref:hypothetical protein n=1 Tax=Sulfonitrofixus jiaomeiensis TaxID=3131938 RepID=UPI0031F7D6A1